MESKREALTVRAGGNLPTSVAVIDDSVFRAKWDFREFRSRPLKMSCHILDLTYRTSHRAFYGLVD